MSNYYGRLVLKSRFETVEDQRIKVLPSFGKDGYCQRCRQRAVCSLPDQEYFCTVCLKMGRNSSLNCFWHAKDIRGKKQESCLNWNGQLTRQQQKVSNEIIASINNKENRLIWAVTGAGKTEMIFPAIDHVIKKGGRVAVVSPRIDVILELAPRLRKAFSKLDLVLLYGDTPEEYHYTKLVLATTHQLLKFSHAFDLLIIDEVDSFPFHGDSMLESAALRARKKIASTIYLTATPTKKLINDYRKKRLYASFLPLRFHQHLLPELTFSRVGDWRKQIIKNRLPRKLKIQIEKYQKSGQRFLLFVPKVSDLKNTLETIESFSEIKGLSVHATDPERKSKVQQMRDRKIQFLVTTTILERGVTFPGIDVIILGADNQIFSVNAIVQIAGRVGRNKDRPSGLVLALIEEKTQVLIQASRQIRFMNEKGLKQLNNVQ
ncbi:DEAD/DEAH box helicase [Oenococcus oeni]|uniref:DEAD/DEAH box helicase n=1 Tax=Oenococcus oeni TaxID=1247 RepID=A0A6N4A668_OENOE|nr:DEAD/DEAH box helicase [Oenococcus oeni]